MHPDHSDKLSRLNKVGGQINGIKKMIEDRRYCIDILTQIKAATSALKKVEQTILKDHINNCLKTAVELRSELEIQNKLNEVMDLIEKRI
ncbi:MAG: metal-sensitive transcriptional regulator [Proteobacteria bacterium]|nr:metal-sensitive transcriptional regulator [Pseudomonadota bacterium]